MIFRIKVVAIFQGNDGAAMSISDELLKGLNDAQREAVTFTGAPQLVLAGAGSGKTRVLTSKIAWLIAERGVRPWRILAVTFTNKAAREMSDRAKKLLGANPGGVQISTFHSFGLNLLFRNRELLRERGYNPNFVIYDRTDSLSAIKRIMHSLNMDTDKTSLKWVLDGISKAKAAADVPIAKFSVYNPINAVFEKYEKILVEQGAFDFDDLLTVPLKFLREEPELLARERARLDWVLVDEYQDVNRAQYQMMKLLVGNSPNLMVVGDPDQSIYGWRGADYSTIMNFEKDFPNAKVTLLKQNYRSTSIILDASNELIQRNKNRREKNLRTDREQGEAVQVWKLCNDKAEAEKIVREIHKLTTLYHYRDIAVLYRLNDLNRAVEDALREALIPYRIVRGTSFYDRKEIRDVIAYMRLAVNPWDAVSMNRVGNLPARALGPKSLEKLNAWIQENGHGTAQDVWDAVRAKKGGLSGKAAEGAESLASHMLKILGREHSLQLVLECIINDIGYEEVLKKTEPTDWEDRVENVRGRLSRAPEGENLSDVLSQISLYTDLDTQNENLDAVILSTIHAAKGLEFPIVFMIGMEEGNLPHVLNNDGDDDIEEERRLCYVGMTRAEERLYMSGVRERWLYGSPQWEDYSEFLDELPDEGVEILEQKEAPNRYGGGYGPYGRARRW